MVSTSEQNCDILIIGAGIFGTSTAYHLTLQSHHDANRITVLDRAPCPSPQAASSDINKIVRADYSKAFYMQLAYEAMDAWSEWPLLKPFYHRTGWVMLDEQGSDLAARIRKNFKAAGRPDPSRDITLQDVRTSWDGVLKDIDTTDYGTAYTNSSAGWADASLAVEAMMKSAIEKGIKYQVGEVSELLSGVGGLDGARTTDGRVYKAKKVLLATGAWTTWLMSPLEDELNVKDEDRIERQIQTAGVCTAAFKVSEDDVEFYSKMPVLIYGAKGEAMPPNRERLFKFTNAHTFTNTETHPFGRKISVPWTNQGHIPEKLRLESLELVRQRVPRVLDQGLTPDWRLCWDAVSPDQSQLICRHPDLRLSNLFLATAGSFHSWKFLPIIGKYVVNVLNGKSNGEEYDNEWKWKREWSGQGAHEKVKPRGELKDFE